MTQDEFRDHLATQLGIKGRGQTLSGDDANYLTTITTNAHAELQQMEVADWDIDLIPDAAVESFVIFCKAHISRFGMDPDPAMAAIGLGQLRYVFSDPRDDIAKAEYF